MGILDTSNVVPLFAGALAPLRERLVGAFVCWG